MIRPDSEVPRPLRRSCLQHGEEPQIDHTKREKDRGRIVTTGKSVKSWETPDFADITQSTYSRTRQNITIGASNGLNCMT